MIFMFILAAFVMIVWGFMAFKNNGVIDKYELAVFVTAEILIAVIAANISGLHSFSAGEQAMYLTAFLSTVGIKLIDNVFLSKFVDKNNKDDK